MLEEWDLMSPTYYNNKIICNTGDFVYFVAGVSYFYDSSINTTFIKQKKLEEKLQEEVDWVKNNFDVCIHMEANMLNGIYKNVMLEKAELFKKMQIPIFILGIGAQSSIDYSTEFISEIEECAKRYLDAVYSRGGVLRQGDILQSI